MIYLNGGWNHSGNWEKVFKYLSTGQAIFETILYDKEILWFWERHHHRLERSLRQLGFEPRLPDLQTIILAHLRLQPDVHRARVKIIILTPFDISPPLVTEKDVILLITPLAESEPNRSGIKLKTAPHPYSESAALSTIKSINYGEYFYGQRCAVTEGFNGVLFLDDSGYLLETSNANIFVGRDGYIFTPATTRRILPGIIRSILLDKALAEETDIHLSDLGNFDFAFTTNSIRELDPVSQIDEFSFPSRTAEYENVLARWNEIKKRYLKKEII